MKTNTLTLRALPACPPAPPRYPMRLVLVHKLRLGFAFVAFGLGAVDSGHAAAPAGPAAFPGGPYRLTRGGSIMLDGSSSNTSTPGAKIVAYDWDVDGDGAFDLSGPTPRLSWQQLAPAPGGSTVTLRVADSAGQSASAAAAVTIVSTHLAVHDCFMLQPDALVYPTGLAEGDDGRLYGVSSGRNDVRSSVWRMNRDGSEFVVLRRFADPAADGDRPTALIVRTDGSLIGLCRFGGANGEGTLWRMRTNGSEFTVLHAFTGDEGGSQNPLAMAADGALFGSTFGSSRNAGTVWRVNADGSGFTILREFAAAADGSVPSAPVFDSAGALYGTTRQGGAHGAGTIWRMNADGTAFAVLRALTLAEGSESNLPVIGPDGLLYGSATRGGLGDIGTIWRIQTDGTGFVVLRQLQRAADYGQPGVLVFGRDGALHTTVSPDRGIHWGLWRLNPDGTGLAVLQQPAGMNPSPLVPGSDGKLYATLREGGRVGDGAAWSVNLDGTGYTVLRHFGAFTTGEMPVASRQLSRLYAVHGITFTGGVNLGGTLWSLDTLTGQFLTWHAFEMGNEREGYNPPAPPVPVISTKASSVYGTTSSTVWRVTSAARPDFTVLRDLAATGDGRDPEVLHSDGWLFGWSRSDGGKLWRMKNDGSEFTTLHAWSTAAPTEGVGPAGVIVAGDWLYGATLGGGAAAGAGTVWRIKRDGSGYTVLRRLDGPVDGAKPFALSEASTAGVVGVCREGGAHGLGTVWRMAADGSGFRVLRHLDVADGGAPASVPAWSGGDRYVGVSAGNPGDATAPGTLWRMNADGSNFIILHRFEASREGANPRLGPVLGESSDYWGALEYAGPHERGSVFQWTNLAPVARFTASKETAAVGEKLTFDGSGSSDADGDGLVYHWQFGDGQEEIATNTPRASHAYVSAGTFLVTLQVTDSYGEESGSETRSITVTRANHPPVAYAKAVSMAEDTRRGITVAGWDPDRDPLTFQLVNGPVHGYLTWSFPTLLYVPDPNYDGRDAFTFLASDGLAASAPATVSILVSPVNDAPVADQKWVTVKKNTPVSVKLTAHDVEGSPLSYAVNRPAHGTLSGNAPNLTYTPTKDYLGSDSFTFTVKDGVLTSRPGKVWIHVIR